MARQEKKRRTETPSLVKTDTWTENWRQLSTHVHTFLVSFLDLANLRVAMLVNQRWAQVSRLAMQNVTSFCVTERLVDGSRRNAPWLEWTNQFAKQLPRLQKLVLRPFYAPSLVHIATMIRSHPRLDTLCFQDKACEMLHGSSYERLKRLLVGAFRKFGHAPLRSWSYVRTRRSMVSTGEHSAMLLLDLVYACSKQGHELTEFRWACTPEMYAVWDSNWCFATDDVLGLVQMPKLHTLDLTGLQTHPRHTNFQIHRIDWDQILSALTERTVTVPWRVMKLGGCVSNEPVSKFASKEHVQLEQLHLTVKNNTSELVLLALFKSCPNLIQLWLDGADQLSDAGLEQLTNVSCRHLERLSLSSRVSLALLAKSLLAPQLTHLFLREDCKNTATPDEAVTFLNAARRLQAFGNVTVAATYQFQTSQDLDFSSSFQTLRLVGPLTQADPDGTIWNRIHSTPYGNKFFKNVSF